MHNRLDTIPACDIQMDGWTDTVRQTDILRQHSLRYAYASRGKNCSHSATLYVPIRYIWHSLIIYMAVDGLKIHS